MFFIAYKKNASVRENKNFEVETYLNTNFIIKYN